MNTLFIGKNWIHIKQVNSTNVCALEEIAKNNPSEGTVISTFRQSAGRGQIGSKWESEADKNISLSIILFPKFLLANQQFYLSMCIALGVYDFLKPHIKTKIAVKWPNDIYINDKKIAGILIQNGLTSSFIANAVVGIGINVNQRIFVSNPPNPTSLNLENDTSYDLQHLSQELCECIEKHYLTLKQGNLDKIKSQYMDRLYRFNEEHPYFDVINDTYLRGTIIDIRKTGQLVINTEGKLKTYNLKEIKFL